MFWACKNVIGRADLIALEPAHLCGGHSRAQIRIFTGTFYDATPTRITSDVDHRREAPINTSSTSFRSGNTLCVSGYFRIPGSSHRDRHWEDSPEAVNYIKAEDERNMMWRFLDSYVLHAIDDRRICNEEQGTDRAFRNEFFDTRPT